MNAVVDTNVLAYYLLGTPKFAAEAGRFWRAVDDVSAPAVWEAELANVVWMAIRTELLTLEEGVRRLRLAARLGVRSVPCRSLWQGALTRAAHHGVSPYDTLFVQLAIRERLRLVTFDQQLLATFPGVARRPAALVG
jgi:predicted nucleic acid-binding protein